MGATHIGRFALHSRQVERTYNFTYRRTLWRKRAPLVVAKTPRKHKDKHARLTLPHRSRLQRTNKQRRQRQRNGTRAQSRMRKPRQQRKRPLKQPVRRLKRKRCFAEKKPRGIDSALGSFDAKPGALNATGIDNALDALDITGNSQDKVDRHPERRFKAAYAAFEERRLDEMKDEKGLRRQQKIDQIRKEFEKHPDNPFNQVTGSYNMTKEEMAAVRESEKDKKEKRLVGV